MKAKNWDWILRCGTVVTPEATLVADVVLAAGKIVKIQASVDERANQELDVSGCYVLPGFIDAHTHFNEPGRTEWEGFATGTRALLAGGGTCFIDMPLNSTPVINGENFDKKVAAMQKNSWLSGALWGGIIPSNSQEIKILAQRGVVGFKAFMCNSGMADFPAIGRAGLKEAMLQIADLQLPVGLHAESEEMTSRLAQKAQAFGRGSVRDYLDSRPIEAEVEAIQEALDLARVTGCSLHFVHVSSAAGLAEITQAKASGLNVTAETCPHYLLFNENAVLQRGAVAKCSPPLRAESERQKLGQALRQGQIDTIGSDHSPAPPEMKTAVDFFQVWGGISGIQHAFPAFFQAAMEVYGLEPERVAQLCSTRVAERFGLPGKGRIAVGYDADIAILKKTEPRCVIAEEIFYRHRASLYLGESLRFSVPQTFVQGHLLFDQGKFLPPPSPPQLLKAPRP